MAAAKKIRLTQKQTECIARALADPRRYQILKQIACSCGSTPCSDIREQHPITPATLSHHTKELEAANLVTMQKDGKFVNYTLRRDIWQAYLDRLAEI